jgi:hypothetical protein
MQTGKNASVLYVQLTWPWELRDLLPYYNYALLVANEAGKWHALEGATCEMKLPDTSLIETKHGRTDFHKLKTSFSPPSE